MLSYGSPHLFLSSFISLALIKEEDGKGLKKQSRRDYSP